MQDIAPPALDPNPLGIHSSTKTNNMDTAICRVCMAKERVMVSIFEAPPGSSTLIADMISQCTGIYISERQAYPKTICRTCMLNAQNAYEFKRTFERSHQYFSQIREEVCTIPDSDAETVKMKDEFEIRFLDPKENSFTDQTERPLLVELLVSDVSEINPSEGTDDRDDNATSSATDRPFKCPQCQKNFIRKDHVARHMRTHTSATDRPFKCPQCQKNFIRKDHVERHMRTHTGERPFQCEHCPKSFLQKHILKKHLFTHTGERPFKCSHCPKAFATKSNQEAHIRMHMDE